MKITNQLELVNSEKIIISNMKVMLIQNLKNQRMPLWNQTILERLKKKKKIHRKLSYQ